jgi:hypothetical protein
MPVSHVGIRMVLRLHGGSFLRFQRWVYSSPPSSCNSCYTAWNDLFNFVGVPDPLLDGYWISTGADPPVTLPATPPHKPVFVPGPLNHCEGALARTMHQHQQVSVTKQWVIALLFIDNVCCVQMIIGWYRYGDI